VGSAPIVAERPSSEGAPHLASPYLSVGHWAYPVVEGWIARGWADHLSPFTRPWRRIEVARALHSVEADPGRSPGGPGDDPWLAALQAEFAPELERLGNPDRPVEEIRGRGRAGGGLHSQTHPDPLRPQLDGPFSRTTFLDRWVAEAHGHMASVVGGVRIARDGRLRNDPRFPNGRVVPGREEGDAFLTALDLRVEEAYVEIQGRRARVSFGRQDRNWGGPGVAGLLRSPEAYSFDELGYHFGSERIFLAGTFTSFRDMPGDTARYHAAHRLEFRIRENLVVGLSEASLHGGPGGRLDLRLISPLAIWELTREGERDKQSNLLGQVDVWWRPHPAVALFGSLAADSPPGVGACCESGGSLGLELPILLPGTQLRARVSAVESLMYRTSRTWEEYSHRGLGLGWDQADVVLVSVEALWWGGRPVASGLLHLNPRFDLQLRGEESAFQGRTRPSRAEMEDFPGLLSGTTEGTLRPSLAGSWLRRGEWPVQVEWDLGINRIRNAGHEPGVRRTEAVGWIAFSVGTPWFRYRAPIAAP
jgi:hypothetical protein